MAVVVRTGDHTLIGMYDIAISHFVPDINHLMKGKSLLSLEMNRGSKVLSPSKCMYDMSPPFL